MSWVLSDKSPLHKNCKVHILSNPEFDFWTDMVDKDDGYIGIKTEGKYAKKLPYRTNMTRNRGFGSVH